MNIFRLLGDLSHFSAVVVLLLNIWKTRSCAGISGKSQILFAVVYTTRYLDLLTLFVSVYNTVMKVIFIGVSYATIYSVYIKFKTTYEQNHDTFWIECLIFPAFALSLLISHEFTILEVLWTFSIYLESVAILPQLFLVSKTGKADRIMLYYLFALGSYRALYLLNWIYRYYFENHYDLIAIVAGVVQTVLYCGFFCLYLIEVAVAVTAVFVNRDFTVVQVARAFSHYLEAPAVIPQLHLISKAGRAKKVMSYYIYDLTACGTLSIFN